MAGHNIHLCITPDAICGGNHRCACGETWTDDAPEHVDPNDNQAMVAKVIADHFGGAQELGEALAADIAGRGFLRED